MIEAREQWLVDAQTVRELREKARAALDSDEIPLIAIGMVQKYTLRQLGLWDQDGEKLQLENAPQPTKAMRDTNKIAQGHYRP